MRLISQDGTIDCPYEQMVIMLSYSDYVKDYYAITARPAHDCNERYKMAVYSTKEKAVFAVDEMLKEFARNSVMFGGYNYPKVYRFPADNESEGADERELKESQK